MSIRSEGKSLQWIIEERGKEDQSISTTTMQLLIVCCCEEKRGREWECVKRERIRRSTRASLIFQQLLKEEYMTSCLSYLLKHKSPFFNKCLIKGMSSVLEWPKLKRLGNAPKSNQKLLHVASETKNSAIRTKHHKGSHFDFQSSNSPLQRQPRKQQSAAIDNRDECLVSRKRSGHGNGSEAVWSSACSRTTKKFLLAQPERPHQTGGHFGQGNVNLQLALIADQNRWKKTGSEKENVPEKERV